MLLPNTCSQGEIEHLKKHTDLNIKLLDVKYNALGNLICVNDKGGIISPTIDKKYVKKYNNIII